MTVKELKEYLDTIPEEYTVEVVEATKQYEPMFVDCERKTTEIYWEVLYLGVID